MNISFATPQKSYHNARFMPLHIKKSLVGKILCSIFQLQWMTFGLAQALCNAKNCLATGCFCSYLAVSDRQRLSQLQISQMDGLSI